MLKTMPQYWPQHTFAMELKARLAWNSNVDGSCTGIPKHVSWSWQLAMPGNRLLHDYWHYYQASDNDIASLQRQNRNEWGSWRCGNIPSIHKSIGFPILQVMWIQANQSLQWEQTVISCHHLSKNVRMVTVLCCGGLVLWMMMSNFRICFTCNHDKCSRNPEQYPSWTMMRQQVTVPNYHGADFPHHCFPILPCGLQTWTLLMLSPALISCRTFFLGPWVPCSHPNPCTCMVRSLWRIEKSRKDEGNCVDEYQQTGNNDSSFDVWRLVWWCCCNCSIFSSECNWKSIWGVQKGNPGSAI